MQDNIRRTLPDVLKEIGERLDKAKQASAALGESCDTASERRHMFPQWATRYLRQLEDDIAGYYQSPPASSSDHDGIKGIFQTQASADGEPENEMLVSSSLSFTRS